MIFTTFFVTKIEKKRRNLEDEKNEIEKNSRTILGIYDAVSHLLHSIRPKLDLLKDTSMCVF